MKKLAIVSTHPIQYNAPWFALLAHRSKVDVKVFYTWSQTEQGPKYDPTFQKVVEWDIPLLFGYNYAFVPNVAKEPGSHHYQGIDNPTLNRTLQAWRPNAVLIIGWSYKSHFRCMRYFKGKVPVLFRGDSTLLDETRSLKTLLRRLFLTWVYKHIDVALYVGTNNRKYFEVHGVKSGQLIKAYHSVDNNRFAGLSIETTQKTDELKQLLGIKPSDFVILFAGKLEEKKNPFFLIELAKRIKDPEVSFVIVGNGHLEEELRNQAAEDTRIKFLPFQNQSLMPALYRTGSIFVLPSHGPGETWGLAANEAMASGLPVILSAKTGGAVDLVAGNGLLFELDEIGKVIRYIEKLKASPDTLQEAKQASLEQIKKFSFRKLAEAVEKACGL